MIEKKLFVNNFDAPEPNFYHSVRFLSKRWCEEFPDIGLIHSLFSSVATEDHFFVFHKGPVWTTIPYGFFFREMSHLGGKQ